MQDEYVKHIADGVVNCSSICCFNIYTEEAMKNGKNGTMNFILYITPTLG
jgi:hypothetical protein